METEIEYLKKEIEILQEVVRDQHNFGVEQLKILDRLQFEVESWEKYNELMVKNAIKLMDAVNYAIKNGIIFPNEMENDLIVSLKVYKKEQDRLLSQH